MHTREDVRNKADRWLLCTFNPRTLGWEVADRATGEYLGDWMCLVLRDAVIMGVGVFAGIDIGMNETAALILGPAWREVTVLAQVAGCVWPVGAGYAYAELRLSRALCWHAVA